MAYSITTRIAPGVVSHDPTLYVLGDGHGSFAEVWPALGFNCVRWRAVRDGTPLELLYADPALFTGGRPTRSGIPVLFPFPNRMRGGRFDWDGQSYQLPLNDPAQQNAIHGFACRVPWRVVDQGHDAQSAWITGEFRCSIDAPQNRLMWPADHEIQLTVRLGKGTLRLEATVTNPDRRPLPFGLGYHPYFRLPFAGEAAADDCRVEVPASSYWPLGDNLPSGPPRPVDEGRDLNKVRRVGELKLDDVLTGLPARAARADGLIERGAVYGGEGGPLRVFCSAAFREMVVFNPAHRQAFCIEPYTCTTDAANLQARGLDAGWQVLAPGATWAAVVEMWV